MRTILLFFALSFGLLQNGITQTLPPKATDTLPARQLKEVVVRGEKPLVRQETYGMVVNVESSVLTKGSSALQVLERSPGVAIDHRYNSIALNGKSGVIIMIDGKTMRMSMDQVVALLNGMSADDIEKIELMTTPPAQYDAEGGAGMINIVLKKNKRTGTNGSFALTQGYGWGEKEMAAINLANNKKYTSLSGSYTFSHDRSYNYFSGESYENFPPLGGPMSIQFQNRTKPVQNNHDARLALDVRLNRKITTGANIAFNSMNGASSNFNHRNFTILPDSLLLFDASVNSANRWRSLVSSIYIEQEIGAGEKLSFNTDYLYYRNSNPTDAWSSLLNMGGGQAGTSNDTLFAPRQNAVAHTLIRVGAGKIDYRKQIAKTVKLETGIKATYMTSSSASEIKSLINGDWVSRPETSNDMVMKEGINAAYVAVNTQISESIKLVAGARYEYSHTSMANGVTGKTTIDRKLGALFPNILFSGKIDDHSDWQLSYTKRITRPTYNDLSSFVAYNDPLTVFTGNQFLSPTITNNLKLGYQHRGYSFSVLLSRDDNPIAAYQLTASPSKNLMFISPQNVDYQNNLTFQTELPWKVGNWWNMSYGFVGGWRQFKEHYTPVPVEKTYFAYSLNGREIFKLPRNFSLEISGWYNSAAYNGNVKVYAVGSLDAGLKKDLQHNGGTFQLAVTDLFKTTKYKLRYGALTPDVFDGVSFMTYYPESWQSQVIKLTYSRSFGVSAQKMPGADTGSGDEQGRIRK